MTCVRGVVLAVAAASLGGCAFASGSTLESVGQTIHSISVSNTIQFRYQGDRVLAPLGLKVETYRQEVFVSGLVQNDAQRARALAVARDTPGVLAAYFVDTDLPGRPVSRAHFRASVDRVWAVAAGAVRAAGYQIEDRQDGRSLVTRWRWVTPAWRTLWLGTQERIRLALHPLGDVVTVIAIADRLDLGSPAWQIEREHSLLRAIREALGHAALLGS
jgi:hypothetical protein